ncbi:hypothetical protein PN36_10895 [Candidatus Thiomargarita nelsonii]|uniref:Uncharacterized protein n=1 Tax=Candidatus Thiomargarita nelsonii TaxID=1003181 RepID=A0A4E0QRA9_9GAMM|nr:hypothetical protein PN36_10895 [Candidatus Thiomargarita nelsonii]
MLHLRHYDAPIHRHDLQRLLEQMMPGYDHKLSATFNYELIREHYDSAKKRAQQAPCVRFLLVRCVGRTLRLLQRWNDKYRSQSRAQNQGPVGAACPPPKNNKKQSKPMT